MHTISGASSLYTGLAAILPIMIDKFDNTATLREKQQLSAIHVMGILVSYTSMILLYVTEDYLRAFKAS